ncbi:hypothetical protein HDV64DRAFT_271409 [Trichoderma sp. TUCIM 5745]
MRLLRPHGVQAPRVLGPPSRANSAISRHFVLIPRRWPPKGSWHRARLIGWHRVFSVWRHAAPSDKGLDPAKASFVILLSPTRRINTVWRSWGRARDNLDLECRTSLRLGGMCLHGSVSLTLCSEFQIPTQFALGLPFWFHFALWLHFLIISHRTLFPESSVFLAPVTVQARLKATAALHHPAYAKLLRL